MAYVFDEVLLPTSYSPNFEGGPEYATRIYSSPEGGITQRNVSRPDGIFRASVDFSVLTWARYEYLLAFYRTRQGDGRPFRFWDASDFKASREPFAAPGGLQPTDGIRTQFKLYKTYITGGVADVRRIIKPVAGNGIIYDNPSDDRGNTVSIFIGDSNVAASNVFVDSTTGLVTFQTAPQAGITLYWSGEFDVPVYFGTNRWPGRVDRAGISATGTLEVIEALPAQFGLS